MTEDIQVRVGTERDLAGLEHLWTMLVQHQESLEPRLRFAPDALDRWRTDVRMWLQSETRRIWVAESDHTLIAFLCAERGMTPPMFEPRIEVLITEVFVAPNHRKQGLGASLVREACDWAEHIGASTITAHVLAANAEARRFWMQCGASTFFESTTIPIHANRAESPRTARAIGFRNV